MYREILADLETPVSGFLKIGNKPYAYLLESVEGGEKLARYSFLASEPSLIFQSKGRTITLTDPRGKKTVFETSRDPLWELEKILSRYKQVSVDGLPPFTGGAAGYLSYDCVRFFERIPDKNKDGLNIPDALFVFTDSLVAFDHKSNRIQVIANVYLDGSRSPGSAYDEATAKIDRTIAKLCAAGAPEAARSQKSSRPLRYSSTFTKPCFEKAVRKAKQSIGRGDIFQVVLSQRLRTQIQARPFDIYRNLRSINPSPYLFYLDAGDFQLVGSSPEIHVRCESGRVMVRPIAGTRPRGKTAQEDARLEKSLLADPKERAEHLMLVDLGRNDLGRVCEYKTVKVPEFMAVERYSHVMHIVSHVEGRLQKGKTVYDVLRATFPAGTVSGAPKVRAMEIIDELEPERRSFYSGVVGYFSYSGNLDTGITIRTILTQRGQAYVQAGAGIVADSVPAHEYEETLNKSKALLKAIELAESGADR